MKAVTFTVKLTDSNIELLHEFKENKQLGLLIRTYFDALAYDRGGTLANLIGLSGGDVVKSSIVAATEVANHYKAYLESGLSDKVDFKDYLDDVEKFTKLPYEGYYGRGLTEKAVRGILDNFLNEIKLNSSQTVDSVGSDKLEDMVSRLLEEKLKVLGLNLGGGNSTECPESADKPISNVSTEYEPIITPKTEVERLERPETAQNILKEDLELDTTKVQENKGLEEVKEKTVEKEDVVDKDLEVGLKSEGLEVNDVLSNLMF